MCYEEEFQKLISFLKSIEVVNLDSNWNKSIQDLFQFIITSNEEFNLTRITSLKEFLYKHIADSLLVRAVIPGIEEQSFNIADVGCGAGFPGIPLALTFSRSTFIEIDSNSKKGDFVASLIDFFGMKNCHAITARARELARTTRYKNKFDLVLVRAVKDTAYLIRECRQLLQPGSGRLVVYKTPSAIIRERILAHREGRKYKLHLTESPIFSLPNNHGHRQFFLVGYNHQATQ